MDKLDLYRCEICGNIVQIMHAGGGELICCGQPMKKLEPKQHEDAVMEKHIPIFSNYEDGNCEIRVGEILHPMVDEHYIMFIQAVSKDKSSIETKFLKPGDEPKFSLHKKDNLYAREFCNIHGLWEGNND